jgi:DNA-binding response OmpR family regulator
VSEPRPRVLLVEDDDAVRDILWESLEQADFAVDTAQTAAEGVEKLATRPYAAIATDCVLPDLTPLDWMVALRGAAPVTPLVLYSGTVTSDDLHLLGRDWAAAAVLEKPFKPTRLVAAVRAAIEKPPDQAQPL